MVAEWSLIPDPYKRNKLITESFLECFLVITKIGRLACSIGSKGCFAYLLNLMMSLKRYLKYNVTGFFLP